MDRDRISFALLLATPENPSNTSLEMIRNWSGTNLITKGEKGKATSYNLSGLPGVILEHNLDASYRRAWEAVMGPP